MCQMKLGEVLRTTRELHTDGMTMMIVTHEFGFAYVIADRVLFLHAGEIFEQGTPEKIIVTPPKRRTREFLAGHDQFRIPSREEA